MLRQLVNKNRQLSLRASVGPMVIRRSVLQRHIHSSSPRNVQTKLSCTRAMSSWGAKDTEMSPRTMLTEIRNRKDHAFTMKAIARGWADNSLPYDDIFLKEYIKAAVATNRIDSMDVANLIADFNTNAANAMQANGRGGGAVAPVGSMFNPGGSEHQPLYVVNTPPKGYWASYLLKIAITGSLLAGVYYYLNADEKPGAQGGGGGGGIASRLTGGMKNNVNIAENPDKSFKDVVGVDEAKAELQEIVMYLKEPQRFTRLGGKLPKGVLLTGPPGTGKTLLAKAIAGEAGVPFFYTSGSEFEEMFVGVGARRVRDMFEAAKAKAPCIIFIDEIDAIGGSRHLKDQSTMKMTLNQLLVEMDGFETNNGVVVIAATNFPDSLDNALTRPGRLDKHVDVPLPDIGGRTAILNLYGSKVPLGKDVDMEQLSRGTPGFSGADLFNLVNQAALKASVQGLRAISMASLEYAKDKIMMGAERETAIISEETIKRTAYHEAGHAVVAHLTKGAEPIHKATVMPRGRALGMVMQLPEGDQTSMTRRQMLARLDVCMGGRVAEELIFGAEEVTSGASSDIQQATRLAHAMVTKYGMSEKVGMIFIEDKGGSGGGGKDVDAEVKELLSSSYKRAYACLEEHKNQLEAVAKGLIQYESLAGSEVVDLIEGKGITLPQHKRSQKPSRDIVPIKNRQRPAFLTNGPKNGDGGEGSAGGAVPPRRVIRRPTVPAPSSANAIAPPVSPSVASTESVRRAWGKADVEPTGGPENTAKGVVKRDKSPSTAVVGESMDSEEPNVQEGGWVNSMKGWFGYGSEGHTDTAEEEEEAVNTIAPPAARGYQSQNNRNSAANNINSNMISDSGREEMGGKRRLPPTVGPPVEKVPPSVRVHAVEKEQAATPATNATPNAAVKATAEENKAAGEVLAKEGKGKRSNSSAEVPLKDEKKD